MTNRNITIQNNLVHDIGIDYRDSDAILATYTTNATISHNDAYNLPYSGIGLGWGWGINGPGGSQDYINRGTYNYQTLYTTPTTATGNSIVGNYVHDYMQQMIDGGCIYTLSAQPSSVINQNYCNAVVHIGSFPGMYLDEGSRYLSAADNVFQGTWSYVNQNANPNNHTGNFTVTGNWANRDGNVGATNSNGETNTVSNNTIQAYGTAWPAGARTIMNAAGLQGGGPITGINGLCVDDTGGSNANGTAVELWGCTGGSGQTWTANPDGSLESLGKCLDITGANYSPGTKVELWECSGGANQQWQAQPNGQLINPQSGLCLDDARSGGAGTQLIIWSCTNPAPANQQWKLP
jgi:hypothetical protein